MMERLTKRELADINGKQIVLCDHKEEDCNDSCMHRRCKWNEKALRKLKAYEDAEEQKLQCKPGDMAWCIEHKEYYRYLYMATCGEFVIVCTEYMSFEGDFESQLEEMQFESLADEGTEVKVFHKDYVFHTKEEAEQALARMEKENG